MLKVRMGEGSGTRRGTHTWLLMHGWRDNSPPDPLPSPRTWAASTCCAGTRSAGRCSPTTTGPSRARWGRERGRETLRDTLCAHWQGGRVGPLRQTDSFHPSYLIPTPTGQEGAARGAQGRALHRGDQGEPRLSPPPPPPFSRPPSPTPPHVTTLGLQEEYEAGLNQEVGLQGAL